MATDKTKILSLMKETLKKVLPPVWLSSERRCPCGFRLGRVDIIGQAQSGGGRL